MFGSVAKQTASAKQQRTKAEQIAHVFRRCTFGPHPGQVEAWLDRGPEALIASLLENEAISALGEDELFDDFGSDSDREERVFAAFMDGMFIGSNQLHERMTWYWQTHFTTSVESSDLRFGWRQHQLIRGLALGNFRDLARQITTDPAMLFYLDGAGSYGDSPNENYSREFLELFTLGRDGGYIEDDVRAAARVFSGWHVDWETQEVNFEPDAHYSRPVTFMGERQRWSIDSLIDFVCDLPACHRHVVTRIYHHFVGPDLSESRRDELASTFKRSGLEIRALLQDMFTGPDFLESLHSRARQPLEWALGALHALGFSSTAQAELVPWQLDVLGQRPMGPPNVAGWPLDDRWGSTSQVVARTSLLLDWELSEAVINSVPPTVDAVLAHCGIYEPSASTRAALDRIERDFSEFDYRLELLFVSALTSPEFTLL